MRALIANQIADSALIAYYYSIKLVFLTFLFHFMLQITDCLIVSSPTGSSHERNYDGSPPTTLSDTCPLWKKYIQDTINDKNTLCSIMQHYNNSATNLAKPGLNLSAEIED